MGWHWLQGCWVVTHQQRFPSFAWAKNNSNKETRRDTKPGSPVVGRQSNRDGCQLATLDISWLSAVFFDLRIVLSSLETFALSSWFCQGLQIVWAVWNLVISHRSCSASELVPPSLLPGPLCCGAGWTEPGQWRPSQERLLCGGFTVRRLFAGM